MCGTCNCNTGWLPGPGELASAALGVAADSAASKAGRRVLFWGLAVPLLPFAVWGLFGWWTIALVALAAVASAAGVAYMRVMSRSVVQARPEPTPQMRAALAARGLRPIPAPGQQARPALPRAMVRSLATRRRALPVAGKALPAVITGRVVPAPVRRAAR